MKRLSLRILSLMLAATGCSDGSDNNARVILSGCADTSSCAPNPPLVVGTERPARVLIPSDYTPTARYPLVITLHGNGVNGAFQMNYLGIGERVDSAQYVLIAPDGTADATGGRFWNDTPGGGPAKRASLADPTGKDYTQIDDVGYIRSLIDEAAAT